MSVAVAPKRLGWWFAADADRSVSLHAGYIVAAGFLGVLWNIVLFVIPFTSRPFTTDLSQDPARDQLLTIVALVVTSCVISTVFRRPIVRVKPLLIPIVAAALMLIGAGLFEILWANLLFLAGVVRWTSTWHYLHDMLKTPTFGMWLAITGFWVTMPMAILYVIALRAVDRGSLSRTSTA